jgi:putative copper export protein
VTSARDVREGLTAQEALACEAPAREAVPPAQTVQTARPQQTARPERTASPPQPAMPPQPAKPPQTAKPQRQPAAPRSATQRRGSHPRERRVGPDRRMLVRVAVLGMPVAAAITALSFGLWLGGGMPRGQVTGLVEAGALTAWGMPLARLAVYVTVLGTVGMLITCILLPREGGELSGPARRCLRSAAWLALAWAAATAAMLLFFWSDVTGLHVARLPLARLFAYETVFPEAENYLYCAALALIIAAGAAVTQTLRGAQLVLLLTCYNLLPLTTLGHARHSSISGIAVTVHVVAISLWVGGLAGLLIYVRKSPSLLAVAVPRFSRLALACFVAVGASGLVVAWESLDRSLSELWGSRYGLLVLCKATALAALGVFGWWHRRRTVRAVAQQRSSGAFVRLARMEAVVMVATVALGVALSRSPAPGATSPTQMQHAHSTTLSTQSTDPSAAPPATRPAAQPVARSAG